MWFPVGSVEFWLVTAAFAAALAWLLRGPMRALLRRLRGQKGPPVRSRRTSLTVGGRPPEKMRR